MAFGGHFGWPKITFDRISRHFRSIRNLFFFKMAASSHFGSRFLPKSIGTDLYSRSVARSNMKLIGAFLMKLWSAQAFSSYFHKMAVWRPFWFSDFLQNREGSSTLGYQWLCQIWIWYAHWCRSYVKHKPWRAAAAAAETAETAPDQNHNIPEISNFGDIITTSPPPDRTYTCMYDSCLSEASICYTRTCMQI